MWWRPFVRVASPVHDHEERTIGLIWGMPRTAVAAGTATAVWDRVSRRSNSPRETGSKQTKRLTSRLNDTRTADVQLVNFG